jgi:hypothetical protein
MADPEPSASSFNPAEVRLWVKTIAAFMSFLDRFGLAFSVMLLLLVAVKWMGTAQTQDDFIRELLFGQTTGGRTLAIFFIILILLSVFGIDTLVRAKLTESAEMKRLAEEKSRWQERALGTELSHTPTKEP